MKIRKPSGTISKSEILNLSNNNSLTIVGIDPGLQNLGIGIIQIPKNTQLYFEEKINNRKRILPVKFDPVEIAKLIKGYSYYLIKLKTKREIQEKLFFIFDALDSLFAEHKPTLVIVEDAFVGINKSSALKLGLARGAILSAIGKHELNLQIISPKEIKMEITKKGDAQKEEVQMALQSLLPNWPAQIQFDASDAIGAAFCGIKHVATKIKL